VKQPHASLDLKTVLATLPAPAYGRRARAHRAPRATNGASATAGGVATSTRFRIEFAKGASMRFLGHLDLMRTWERALRRSGLPLAFTQGHHPHIKMSFGPPLPLGFRSRAEVFDLELYQPPGVDLAERLNAVLPDGLTVTSFKPILYKTPSLMSQLEGASYRMRFPGSFLAEAGIAPGALRSELDGRVSRLLARDVVLVRRVSEDKAREFDAKPSIVALHASLDEAPAVLDLHLRFTLRAAARPDDLIGLLVPAADPRTVDVERTALWAERGGERLSPLRLLTPHQG